MCLKGTRVFAPHVTRPDRSLSFLFAAAPSCRLPGTETNLWPIMLVSSQTPVESITISRIFREITYFSVAISGNFKSSIPPPRLET